MSAEALAQAISCLRENNEPRGEHGKNGPDIRKERIFVGKVLPQYVLSLESIKVDRSAWLAPQDIACATKQTGYQATRSFIEMTWIERMNYIVAKSSNRVLDKLPRRHRSKLGAMLPTRIKSLILKWVLRNPYL